MAFKELEEQIRVLQKRQNDLQGASTPTGSVMSYAGAVAPSGWLLCDGSAVSRTDYAALFDVLGAAYGAGNGTTTFNLPNLKGRTPVGRDAAQTEFDVLGETGGEKAHTLTVAEMPSHRHDVKAPSSANGANQIMVPTYAGTGTKDGASNTGQPTEAIGGGGAHNNMPPYVVLNYIIKI